MAEDCPCRRLLVRQDVQACLLAFRQGDGILATRERIGAGESTFTIGAGKDYNLYLFANAPGGLLDDVLYEEDLANTYLRLEDDTPACPVLFGTAHLGAGQYDSPIDFILTKYLSKVTLGNVAVKWLDEYDLIPACTISKIALMSAAGSIPLVGGPSADGTWYNCGSIDSSLPDDISGKILLSSPVNVTGSSAIPMNLSFYAMPNPLGGDGWGLPWSPRRTRLALELTIDGIPNWYPIDIPPMECGCEYLISDLVITGPGSSNPDEKILRSKIELNVEVKPWETATITMEFN